jgi:serine/threonine-protein kinase
MSLLGDYRIGEKIAEGGMATVYKGVQVSLNRPVAIKILAYSLTDNPEIVRRFADESLIIARLRHPNIIHVIDRGITNGLPYFIMDYVEGSDLASLIGRRDATIAHKLDIAVQISKALAYAHRNGVIHRDIKPGNILLDEEGQVYVTDFGIAELFGRSRDGAQAGLILGTPGYMSPEQAAGSAEITAASDIYAFGVILYELFTGVQPSAGLRRPSEIDQRVPAELDEVILRCLNRDARARYAEAGEIKERLREILGGAHLQAAQKERVQQDSAAFTQKNVLLDVLRESRSRSVCLYENRANDRLIVTKRVYGRKEGLVEARLLASHPHPHIAHVHGVSSNDRAFIVVMEYLAGGSLRDRMARVMPWQKALPIVRDVCAALEHAHRHEVLHGNLRPANILFSSTDEVKVADFGMLEPDADAGAARYQRTGRAHTREGDLYAVGVMLHELLLGSPPVFREGMLVPDAALKAFPADVRHLVIRFLATERPEQFAEFEEARRMIGRTLGDRPEDGGNQLAAQARARRRRLFWLAAGVLLAALGGWFAYLLAS